MNGPINGGPEEEGLKGAGIAPGTDQPPAVMETQEGQEDPGRGMQQQWEAQWQQFLKMLQVPQSVWGNPKQSDVAPWDDAKAFLASFEQVAAACGWPRGEWVARLLPALSGEAQRAFGLLPASDKEDYGKVKAAILRGEALRREMQRQHFRQFCCLELGDPRKMYSQVQELCCQWLKPEKYTKEQILELLILEQFLASLPVDAQSWVRAGGPDSCAQAVALLEAFLMSRRETEAGMWQEPLQEWALGPLEAKALMQRETSREHSEIFRDTQQNIKGEISLPGLETACSTSVLPPKDHDMDELSEALAVEVEQVINPREIGVPFHMVEETPVQSSQQTTFWKVLQEDENVDSLEASLSPQLGLDPNSVIKEETFLPDPVESQRFPDHGLVGSFSPQLGLAPHPVKNEKTFLPDSVENQRLQDSDEWKGTRLKGKNSQPGGKKSVQTPRRQQGRTQKDVPETAEMQEERCESSRGQGIEPLGGCKESGELPEDLGSTSSNPSPAGIVGKRASSSKYGRRNHPKSGLVFEQTGEQCNEGPLLEEKIKPKSKLDIYLSSHMEEQNHDCPELEVRLPSNSEAKCKITYPGKKNCKCPDCGKNFSQNSSLTRHQTVHTEKKPHQCPVHEKILSPRSHLLTYQNNHTGAKPQKCPQCGKSFTWRSSLLRHQMVHTGKKPHKCPECGKNYSRRSGLLRHQMIHKGMKPHQCLECGKNFSQRSHLLSHQNTHAGEKPHKCLQCGKSFSYRSDLLIHNSNHTGEKPHKCFKCGKSFSWLSRLLIHLNVHTGEKPHKCSDCGKSFSQRSNLFRHQKRHTKRNPMDVLCVGKA